MKKIAVVLFNLGGPDDLKAVKPFLFNLFNDRAIIDQPQPLRAIIAKIISLSRSSKVKAIYKHIGGKSPILDLTTVQAEALEQKLKIKNSGDSYKTFVCMRYWNPMSNVVVKKVKAYAPDKIILLPLYPQYSTTTTASSLSDWQNAAKKAGLDAPLQAICCYPTHHGFIAAHVKLIKDMYWKASEHGKPRLLFSAHGLPKKIIAKGDPYQWQVEKTVAAITQVLAIDNLDYRICYQSKVGPLEWIGPSTLEEIDNAGKNGKPVLVIPVAFVSEHSETLVELDVEYRAHAEAKHVPGYYRVPALGAEDFFIDALADMCLGMEDEKITVTSSEKKRICPADVKQCGCAI